MKLSEFFPQMEGWTPVNVPSAPPIPNQETQVNPYLRTTMPLLLQYTGDTVKQYNRPGLSSFRTAPIAPAGIPTINSTAAGVTKIITQSVSTAIELQTNGVNNADQQKLNLIAGSGVTLDSDGSGGVEISASGGGSIGGTITNPHVPYASGANTLSDTPWTYLTSQNAWENGQAPCHIKMASGSTEVALFMDPTAGFPAELVLNAASGSGFVGVSNSEFELFFSRSADFFEVNDDSTGLTMTLERSSTGDSAILDVTTNRELFQIESGLGCFCLLANDTDGSADFEMGDTNGNFAELFMGAAASPNTSFFLLADPGSSNTARIDINKGGTVGTVALTLTSPKPSIAMGSSTSPTLFAGSGAPTGSAPNGSLYLRSGGTHAGLSLLYVYDAATTSWIGIA